MAFDMVQFCDDHSILYSLTGKNISQNYVGLMDIYAVNDTSYHLGFHKSKGYLSSWKTGWHSLNNYIQDILNVSAKEAYKIIAEYSSDDVVYVDKAQTIKKSEFKISNKPIKKSHGDFLRSRGFNAGVIKTKYDLRSDGYKIVIPVYYQHQIVSFQERDVRQKFYKNCPLESAIMNNKEILYNIDNIFNNVIVIVEGITDVWRLGDNSVCTFGTSYTKAQSYEIARLDKHTIILFDNEKPAQRSANKLAIELDMMGCSVSVNNTLLAECGVNDPGELSEKQSQEYMNQLLTKFG